MSLRYIEYADFGINLIRFFFFLPAGRCSFFWKNITFFEIFKKLPSLARSVPKPLKVPSLARSVPKPLKVPSLARSVPKPLLIELREAGGHQFLWMTSLSQSSGEAGGLQTRHCHRCRPPTSWLWVKWKVKKWKSEKVKLFGWYPVATRDLTLSTSYPPACRHREALVVKWSDDDDEWSIFGPFFFLKLIYIIDNVYT